LEKNMNSIKAAAILFFATAAAAAIAAEPAAAPAPVTREQVKQELTQAIAAGEIRHGDLADFQALVTPSAPRAALADNRNKADDGKTAAARQSQQQQPAASSGR
jgi:hypothetical protein